VPETHARRQHQKFGHVVRELRRVARTGALVGVLLSSILTAWLLVANRVPSLERFAGIRNAIAVALLLLAAVIPVVRFRNSAKGALGSYEPYPDFCTGDSQLRTCVGYFVAHQFDSQRAAPSSHGRTGGRAAASLIRR
jgi:hypothetical protein